MSTKIIATAWVSLCLILYIFTDITTQAQDSTSYSYQSSSVISKCTDSVTTKDVIDNAKIVRDQFVAQKESLRDKVQILQDKQTQIKGTQQKIDSFTTAMVNQQYHCQ